MHHKNNEFTKQVIVNTIRYKKIQYGKILEMFLKYPLLETTIHLNGGNCKEKVY